MTKLRAGLYVITLCAVCCITVGTFADPLKSPNYQFQETSLGGIGSANTQSLNYQAGTSGGILGYGNSAASSFQINNGHETTSEPALAFAVTSSNASFGNFSTGAAATTTASFQVSNYTSFGYIVQVFGNPPTNGSHTIAAMSATDISRSGTEQFGINLVANTSPISFGANPNLGQFGTMPTLGNYGTVNNYRYVSGDTIVTSPKSSGVVVYTISYIANVSSLTPGGQYGGQQTLLCTGTY